MNQYYNDELEDEEYDKHYHYSYSYMALGEFEDVYDIEWQSVRDDLDGESLRTLENGDYDIDVEYPKHIKRVDGEKFTEYDVENIEKFFADFKRGKHRYVPGGIAYEIHNVAEGQDQTSVIYSFV